MYALILNDEPICKNSRIDTALPAREKLLILIELPKDALSITESFKHDPIRARPMMEHPEPPLKNPRILKLEPMCIKSTADIAEPHLKNDLTLILLPICTCILIEAAP
jgi:hypothetical protein